MQDLYLKFSNEAEARSVLYRMVAPAPAPWDVEAAEEAAEASGRQAIQVKTEPYEVPNFANIDHIGTIYKPTGKMLQSDEGEVPEMAALDGYHVNVRVVGEDATALEPYQISPDNPVRGWA